MSAKITKLSTTQMPLFFGILIAIFIFSLFTFNLKDASASFTVSRPPTLNAGLVGHWTFDGADTNFTTNTVTDRSGNGNTGTMTNMSTSTARAPGKIGQALKFDGVNDYVRTADINALDSNYLSISQWVFVKEPNAQSKYIFSKQDGAGANDNGISLITYNNKFRFDFYDTTITKLNNLYSNTSLSNNWYHIVTTYDGTYWRIYVNGALDNTPVIADYSPATSQIFTIGAKSYSLSSFFPGLIDEVRIYNRALSASEVKSLYNQSASKFNKTPTNILTSGLVGHWTFDGADTNFTTNTVTDRSGNGNTGTMTNMSASTARAPGKIGQALRFDGVNDYVQKTSTASLQITTGTWGAWIKTNSTKANQGIIDKSSVGGGGLRSYYMEVWGTNLGCVVYVPTYYPLTSTGNLIKVGNWHHVVCVYDGSTLKAYIDGVFNSSLQAVGSINIDSQLFEIGKVNLDNARVFDGLIDEVRIYNRALSSSEVKTLYNMGR